MDFLRQSALLVGVTSFTLGFSVLVRNFKNVLFLAFALLTTLISLWALAFFLDQIWLDHGFYRLHLFCHVLLGPACLYLIQIMLKMKDSFSRVLFVLSIIFSIFFSFFIVLNFQSFDWILQCIYFSPILVVFQILELIWLEQKSKYFFLNQSFHLKFNRKSFIYLGALFVLLTSVMDHLPWGGVFLPSLGNLGLSLYLFFLSQAITQQRLLNMSVLISRFLVLLIVAVMFTLLDTFLVAWIAHSPSLFFLNSFIASFLILNLLDPLRTMVRYFTERLLTQKNRKLKQTLSEAQLKLRESVASEILFQSILGTVQQVLEPQWASLFILRGDGTQFRRVRVVGSKNNTTTHLPFLREILAEHPILQYCKDLEKKSKFPVVLDKILENEMDRSASRLQRERFAMLMESLKALGANLLIPLFYGGKMLGFVGMHISSPPKPWGNNWGLLPMIYQYFEQAAQAIQSREVYAQLREKERLVALGEMAAGLAHEIRNPLGAIKGAAQYLDPSIDRPESRFLQVIIDEVDRLNRVVTQFLDYSKPAVVEFYPVDLVPLVSKTVDLMRPSFHEKIQLRCELQEGPIYVKAAAEQIQQVLINLLNNAQNAIEGHEGWVQVSIHVETLVDSSEVVLSVEDTGHGINKENLDKLFIPFFTTSPQGTGLGLSISHKIVEGHHGRIEVMTEEGVYTKISVILPRFYKEVFS